MSRTIDQQHTTAVPSHAHRAIEEHMLAAHLRLGGHVDTYGPLRLFSNPVYRWTAFNAARLTRPIDEQDVDRLLDYVVRYYTLRALRPVWDLDPNLAPPQLPRRLAAEGFVLDRYESLMVRNISPAPTVPCPPGLSIDPVGSKGLDAFLAAYREGFGFGADSNMDEIRRFFEHDLASGWEFWVGRQGGRPAATLACLSLDGLVQIVNVSTVPAARRRGIARAMVAHCLAAAHRRGAWLTYLHAASGSSAERLYHDLGFVRLATWLTYTCEKGERG